MNILLVDDEVLVTRGLSMQLGKHKPQWNVVGQAENGEEAIRLLDKQDVDIVVTDIRMPVMDGLELTRRLVHKRPGIKIVILSGYAEFEYARQALHYGVIDYLLKPVDYRTLIDMFEKLEQELTGSILKIGAVEAAVKYVEKNYASPVLSLTEVAEIANLSPPHFSRSFKQYTGESFIQFLTNMRIEKAKQLLEHSHHMKVYAIGEEIGYTDKHYFNQVFKKNVGVTPVQYREAKNHTKSSNI